MNAKQVIATCSPDFSTFRTVKNLTISNPKQHIASFTDQELVARFRETGDNDYMSVLFARYSHLVYGLCLNYLKNTADGKDAVIQIFEQVMDKLRKHEVQHFKSWIYQVSKNFCLMQLRERKSARKKEEAFKYSLQSNQWDSPSMEEHRQKEELLSKMEEALQLLKPEQKACVELFYLQSKCYQQIADETGYSLKKVKSFIQNGKRNLKIHLSQQNEPGTAQ